MGESSVTDSSAIEEQTLAGDVQDRFSAESEDTTGVSNASTGNDNLWKSPDFVTGSCVNSCESDNKSDESRAEMRSMAAWELSVRGSMRSSAEDESRPLSSSSSV